MIRLAGFRNNEPFIEEERKNNFQGSNKTKQKVSSGEKKKDEARRGERKKKRNSSRRTRWGPSGKQKINTVNVITREVSPCGFSSYTISGLFFFFFEQLTFHLWFKKFVKPKSSFEFRLERR